ncbi:hypothetical protein [Kineococcus radiotolerans]|uniref:Uncharacterized protein n=1 Tax=Kineococcus radiotolerans (strain ATCC BAA-149 / DSM 14245 / SRS30216) TaxID=266940 RepID=A6WH51_KINRD|nr:hypothetical protein [Kineococcus radiotolerans]ABS06140.1 hypothetical protein Krad_4682 [Kineococcus radiotolerans SRS30216 = ATCC BAA-149]
MTTPTTPAEQASTGTARSVLPPRTITVSLRVENAYADEVVVTTVDDETIPAPPTLDERAAEYDEWVMEHIYPFTGTGRCDDATYEARVTACDDPGLVNRVFSL